MKTLIPIAFCLNKAFLLLLKVALGSLLRNAGSDTFYQVYIVANDLDESDRRAIDEVIAPFRGECSVVHRAIDDATFGDRGYEPMHGSYSYYYRSALPELIPEHDTLLYSDADVLFFGDLAKYAAIDLGDNFLGVVQFDHPSYFTDDYEFDGKYFASGNLLMNLKACRTINLLDELSTVARRYQGRLRHYDQDCLNVLFYDKVTYLPLNFCVNHKLHQDIARDRYFTVHLRNYPKKAIWDAIEHPDIVHYTGPKPDKTSPSCKIWQRACAQTDCIDEYVESVINERKKQGKI